MIYSLARSLDVSLFFEDRPYRLGETIEVTVDLHARRDVKVRKARVDLVYDVRWTTDDTDRQSNPLVSRAGLSPPRGWLERSMMHPGPGGRTSTTFGVPKHRKAEHRGSYVLGSSSFLEQTQQVPNTSNIYNIRLPIHKDEPPYVHFKGVSMGWSLVAVVDVARALDVQIRRDVKITID